MRGEQTVGEGEALRQGWPAVIPERKTRRVGGGCLSCRSWSVSPLPWLLNTCDPLGISNNLAGG